MSNSGRRMPFGVPDTFEIAATSSSGHSPRQERSGKTTSFTNPPDFSAII